MRLKDERAPVSSMGMRLRQQSGKADRAHLWG